MAIPAAILIGYLASLFSRQSMFGLALATVLVVLAGSFTYDAFQKVDSNIITLQEPLVYATKRVVKYSDMLLLASTCRTITRAA